MNLLERRTPAIMPALDLNWYWRCQPSFLIHLLKEVGCTHYKVHDPFPGMDLQSTAALLRRAAPSGKRVVVMNDNKELDIPSRVLKAVENHLRMGFDLTTVHARGGPRMLEALEKAGFGKHVVVVLTLTSEYNDDLMRVYGKTRVELDTLWATMACEFGIEGGVVCGASEIPQLRTTVKNIPFITPGVYVGKRQPDQPTSATPKEAAGFGSHCLVVGRSIMGSDHMIEEVDGRHIVKKRGQRIRHPGRIYNYIAKQIGER